MKAEQISKKCLTGWMESRINRLQVDAGKQLERARLENKRGNIQKAEACEMYAENVQYFAIAELQKIVDYLNK